MKPTYTISVLTMNSLPISRQCIEAVLDTKESIEVLITLNGSNDGSLEHYSALRDGGAPLRLIHNPENLGFQVPNERALAEARGEFMVFLNDDAIPPKDWLGLLRAEFDKHPKAALAGASGTCCSFDDGATEFLGVPGPLQYIELSCAMGRTELLREVGLFSPFLKFCYGEDVELSLRLRSMGYTLHQAPFVIEHRRAASANQVPRLREYQAHNHAFLLKRWGQYLRHRRLDLPFIVRRTGAWGDCVLVTPLLRAIKEQNPASEIFVETACLDVFANNPHVAGVARSWQQHYRWATMINLDGAYENRPMTNYLDAYEQEAGVVIKDKAPELFLNGGDGLQASIGEGEWVALHPGPSWPSRMWTGGRWNLIATDLRLRGMKVMLIGGVSADTICCDLDLRGKTTARELMAAIDCCELFVGIDSFPLHVAMALKVPAVGLFGISYSRIVIPKGANAIGVDSDPAHPLSGSRSKATGVTEMKCLSERSPMNTIEVSAVLEAVNRIYLPV